MTAFGARVEQHSDRTAIIDPGGVWSYASLADHAALLAGALDTDGAGVDGARVALLCEPGHDFVVAVLACWRVGGLAVPLHPAHPDAELAYFLADSEAAVIVCSPAHEDLAHRIAGPTGATVVPVGTSSTTLRPPVAADPARRAMMLYTSGTTGRPKGVVHTHDSLRGAGREPDRSVGVVG